MIHTRYDLIGTTLGRYRIIRRIGQGGYANVFLARQENLSRHVAVKVLLPQVFTDSSTYRDALARFKREAEAIAQANHENIITIHDYGEQDGLVYLVMPLFSNGSLRDLLERRRKLSLRDALGYLDQAAAALDYAHGHNIVHRDLKPGNFLLDEHGRLVLTDFGIAHLTQDRSGTKLTRTDVSLGTPAYMAPEVICPDMLHGEEVDGRADIYALGILLFEMLSGNVPFQGESTYAVLLQHLSKPLPSLYSMNSSIPSSVDTVLQKATAKRREERYVSAGEFARAFRAAIAPSQPVRPAQTRSPFEALTYLPPYNPPPMSYSVISAGRPTIVDTAKRDIPPLPQTVYAPQPPVRKRLGMPRLALMLCVILIAIAGGVWFSHSFAPTLEMPTPVPTLTQAPLSCQALFPPQMFRAATLTPEQAQSLVRQYYCYWNEGEYHLAYNLLGAAYRNQHPWQDPNGPPEFRYSATSHSDVTDGNVDASPDGTFQVQITDKATETNGTSTYTGYFIVGKDKDGTWRLLEPHLSRVGS